MTKDDFRNSTNISLGSNIPDAISTYVFDDSYGRELVDLYWRETNAGNVYICLVAQKGKKPFLVQLPKPGEYKPVKNSDGNHSKSSGFSGFDDDALKQLIAEGKRDSEIVETLWGIKPSRSEEYSKALAHVKSLRDES